MLHHENQWMMTDSASAVCRVLLHPITLSQGLVSIDYPLSASTMYRAMDMGIWLEKA
jgi:hypothetical protein